jgi:hypothetical protein
MQYALKQYFSPYVLFIIVIILCSLLITGCGNNTNTTKTDNNTTTISNQELQAMQSSMDTYNGNGYSFKYPDGWVASSVTDGILLDGDAGSLMIQTTAVKTSTDSTQVRQAITSYEQSYFKNGKSVSNIAVTKTFAGQTWQQMVEAGTANGETNPTTVDMLATIYPAHKIPTTLYVLTFECDSDNFTLETKQTFDPMLQSFQFTS